MANISVIPVIDLIWLAAIRRFPIPNNPPGPPLQKDRKLIYASQNPFFFRPHSMYLKRSIRTRKIAAEVGEARNLARACKAKTRLRFFPSVPINDNVAGDLCCSEVREEARPRFRRGNSKQRAKIGKLEISSGAHRLFWSGPIVWDSISALKWPELESAAVASYLDQK